MNVNSLLVLAALAVPTVAQVSETKPAIASVRKSHPEVIWNEESAVSADVNCDGKLEAIVVGAKRDREAVIAVVSLNSDKKQSVFKFPIRSATQDGFCAKPARIELSPLDCDPIEKGALPGCKSVKGCQQFTVADDDCDPFNFYWDAAQKKFAWWRN